MFRWAEYGDLLEYIEKFGSVSENQASIWCYQIVKAIKYLHSMKIAHRDIKSENILITKNINIILADFGFAREVNFRDGNLGLSSTYCGSRLYAAPELFKGRPYVPTKVDIWALGCVLVHLIVGQLTYRKKCEGFYHQILIEFPDIMKQISIECKEVIFSCLTDNPNHRPNIEQIFKMKWFTPLITWEEEHSRKQA